MRIQLESIPQEERTGRPIGCWVCERRFVVGAAAAWAYSDEGIDCGPVCPTCIEEGPEEIHSRLEKQVEWSRRVTEQKEEFAGEAVTAPTIEELRLMEQIVA